MYLCKNWVLLMKNGTGSDVPNPSDKHDIFCLVNNNKVNLKPVIITDLVNRMYHIISLINEMFWTRAVSKPLKIVLDVKTQK